MNWKEWLDRGLDVAKVVAGPTPIGAVLTIVDTVVDENLKDKGVNDDDVLETLSSMMKSKWNSLTPGKIERIKAILEEEPIIIDEWNQPEPIIKRG